MRGSCSIWVDCVALCCLVSIRIAAAILVLIDYLETIASLVRLVDTTKLIGPKGCLGVCWLALLLYQYFWNIFISLFSGCQATFLIDLFADLICSQLHACDNHRIFNICGIALHNIKAYWFVTKQLIEGVGTRIKIYVFRKTFNFRNSILQHYRRLLITGDLRSWRKYLSYFHPSLKLDLFEGFIIVSWDIWSTCSWCETVGLTALSHSPTVSCDCWLCRIAVAAWRLFGRETFIGKWLHIYAKI